MKITRWLPSLAVLWAVLPPAPADETPVPAKVDYAALSRLIHKVVVAQLPKVYEGQVGWGNTIPIPDGLKRLGRRKVVQVGDRLELPHGPWRKVRVWMDDPDRDLKIQVGDLHSAGKSTYHLTLAVDAALRGEMDLQRWQKGLRLLDVTAYADARVGLLLGCDVKLTLDAAIPPQVKVEPQVTDLKTDLKEFNLRRIEPHRLPVVIEGEAAREVGNSFKGVLQDLMRSAEPTVKEYANQAIARGLREGKGTFSAAALLKALGTKKD
jgi:hypothetical protein